MAKRYFWHIAALALACFAPGVTAQTSSGTAFAVAPELLVTNEHVIAGCASVDVITSDGRSSGSVVDSDSQVDLALLRVTAIKGPTARLRKPRNVRLGESVMVFGFPLTGSLSSGGNFTSGHISALRGLRDAAGEYQITAPVQPGNSGGPLMDASGLVIGVVQAKLDALRSAIATGDIPQNVNFAISLEVLAEFLAKNHVPFRDDAPSAALGTDRVAELAQNFTYRVECRGRSKQVDAPADREAQDYAAALSQFKMGNYQAARAGFLTFMANFPNSLQVSSAQYWVGNTYYATRDYKLAILSQEKVLASWPGSAKVPDALLNIASCQAEMGEIQAARETLRALIQKYPTSPAAEQAKMRLQWRR